MLGLLRNLWDTNEKELRRLRELTEEVNLLEDDISGLSDGELRAKTDEFRERLEGGEVFERVLPEAFAVVREASRRVVSMRHFDVQIMGAIALFEGKIAEMKTGEGKTLVAVCPAYLHALEGKGVHIVTVNDYLAGRDRDWMGPVYEFLGLSAGVILHHLSPEERREAYECDITYGTNNEFGFDYLRDNMAMRPEHLVQRELEYAIVDEVDSILIDEARTPLIISGAAGKPTEVYFRYARLAGRLARERDYTVDEKAHTVTLTEEGVSRCEQYLKVENLYDDVNMELGHHVRQALKAKELMRRDRDYVVKDGQVTIVDQFTGRLMHGRRYSDGLHQAIEAKEGVKIEEETQTLASITFQNYFRMYDKLAGMTGTAETEEEEFRKIYGLEVVVIPTNEPMIREDLPDVVYKTENAKFNATVEEIVELYGNDRPVLVGTVSIEKSERLSRMLQDRAIPHEVLNAKHHEREAEIIMKAGEKERVTIATNMAGRGADIVLGEGVVELGGLHIVGTERHESRRIDNQLRGRSGRQGDPGSSRFYVSLEDDLMRLFGSDLVSGLMERLGWQEDQPIEHRQISRAIERAQKRVEGRNFELRKSVLEYDDVLNEQREVIYRQRRQVLVGEDVRPALLRMMEAVVENALDMYADEKVYSEEWDLEGLLRHVGEIVELPDDLLPDTDRSELERDGIRDRLVTSVQGAYVDREKEIGEESMRDVERAVMLHVIDRKWMDHLHAMDNLREGIGLRAYGQRDPLVEYKYEAFEMFQAMTEEIREDIVRYVFRVRPVSPEEALQTRRVSAVRTERRPFGGQEQAGEQPVQRRVEKIGRNDPCPCGSGKKYKKCCLERKTG